MSSAGPTDENMADKTGTMRGVPPPVQTSGRRASEQLQPRTHTLQIVGEKYRVLRKIGEGSFGIIHEGNGAADGWRKVSAVASTPC